MRAIRAGPRGSHPGWLVNAGGTVFSAASDAMDLPGFGGHGVVRRLGPWMLTCISSC
jgi:hypothetical protein